MANLIASGTTLANSADIVLAANEEATLSLLIDVGGSDAAQPVAYVQKKGSDNAWYTYGELNRLQPSMVLRAAGTYRVQRQAYGTAFAVDKD